MIAAAAVIVALAVALTRGSPRRGAHGPVTLLLALMALVLILAVLP